MLIDFHNLLHVLCYTAADYLPITRSLVAVCILVVERLAVIDFSLCRSEPIEITSRLPLELLATLGSGVIARGETTCERSLGLQAWF